MSCVIDTNEIFIFGIPPYLFFAGVGFLFAFGFYMLSIAKEGISVNKNGIVLLLCIPGLLIGALFFGFLTKLFVALYNGIPLSIKYLGSVGIVFYGGLTGVILSFLLFQKIINKRMDKKVLNIFATIIPLFHCFARIGCFFAGCCYGKAVDSFLSVNYVAGDQAQAMLRIPVQLMEAGANLLIFILLFLLLRKGSELNLLNIYLIVYSICRFLLEFLRGDKGRGEFGILSFSQIYSLLIMIGLIMIFIMRRKQKHENS